MTVNATINAALTGLNAATRAAQVVSSNISNAMTEGYARRELEIVGRTSGAAAGGGVEIRGVRRIVDPVLLADGREAEAVRGDAQARAQALERIGQALGVPGEPGALGTRVADIGEALISTSSRPDSDLRLGQVLSSAQELGSGLAAASREIQQVRTDADQQIAREVERLNEALARTETLNARIKRQLASGSQPNDLLDQRQKIVDDIARLVPLREVARPDGEIALYTSGGTVLLNGRRTDIGFAASPAITPDMTVAGGALGELTVDGRSASVTSGGRMGGGELGALFAVRDEIAPRAQTGLDALARDLIARFEAADAESLAPSGLGLFTDNGNALDPADETGLSARITVNPAADPAAGGALWRLRAGLGAAQPGDAGETANLRKMSDHLDAARVALSGGITTVARSFSGLTTDLTSAIGTESQGAQTRASFATAQADTLRKTQLADAVDTDAELQKLLNIERAYAANAQVLRAADEMLQTLLGR